MEVQKQFGKELGLDIKVEGGKVIVSITADTSGVDVSLSASLEAQYFVDKLKEAIPGDGLPETLIDMLASALIKK